MARYELGVGLFISKAEWKKNQRLFKTPMSLKDFLTKRNLSLAIPTEKLTLRHETDSFLSKLGVSLPLIFESDLLPVVARAIMEGIGIGFLPNVYMEEERKLGLVKKVSGAKPLWKQTLFLFGSSHLAGDKRVSLLMESLKESLKP